MAIYALIHGASDVGWYWHLVERELQARGHCSVAPDLPIEDDDATLTDNARTVADAIEPLRVAAAHQRDLRSRLRIPRPGRQHDSNHPAEELK